MKLLIILLVLLLSCKEESNFQYIDEAGTAMACYSYTVDSKVTVCVKDTQQCKREFDTYQRELAKTYIYTPFYYTENMASMSKFLRDRCAIEFLGLGFVKQSWWYKWSEQ